MTDPVSSRPKSCQHSRHREELDEQRQETDWRDNYRKNQAVELPQRQVIRPKTAAGGFRQTPDTLQQQNEALLRENERLLNRLSEITSSAITYYNPDVADLSNENRPTKLAEKFSELYANEWSDAFESLADEAGKPEMETIEELLCILMKINKMTMRMSKKHLENLQAATFNVPRHQRTIAVPQLLRQRVSEFRKTMASSLIPFVEEAALQKIGDKLNSMQDNRCMMAYVKQCVELTWLMNVQDIPMVMAADAFRKSAFDQNLYKPYTKAGTRVDYVVWPVLYLYRDGPIVSKGVAQPI